MELARETSGVDVRLRVAGDGGGASWSGLEAGVCPERTFYASHGKRLFDVAVALFLILVLLPVMVGLVVLIRMQVGGPGLLFRQERIGLGGRPFTMLKFRTMLPDRRRRDEPFDGDDRRRCHKQDSDPRHTSLGRVLRRASLDELPQLFNVVRGEMSLVGPRPELAAVARANGLVGHARHDVRPGITGLWQISDLRRGADLVAGLELDEAYLAGLSLRADLRILFKTVAAVVSLSGR